MLMLNTGALALVAAGLTIQAPAAPQAGPPATEVFLAPLTLSEGTVTVGRPENISNSPGYDNQPFFDPDGRALFFTSARGSRSSSCGNPQTDIYRFDLESRRVSRVTDTAECEYSPTVTPDGRHLSVIRVEPDGTQRLWRFTIDGASPSVVLADVKPVGYHAWIDGDTLALFVLGQPATLQIAHTGSGRSEVAASDIGQSIQKMPNGRVSFVQQAGDRERRTLTISEVSLKDGQVTTSRLTDAVPGATQAHVTWTPDGTLLMAHDETLYAWKTGQAEWRAVADLASLGLRNVTRLAVSPRGDRIAIVALPR
jgi:hypothetical protein